MRNRINFNSSWNFTKDVSSLTDVKESVVVDLPHTWNAEDGHDGGNDYFRGSCRYLKKFNKTELPDGKRFYVEVKAANSSADLYINGKNIKHHDGGYSIWRADITDELSDENEIAVIVDNSPNDFVYPQMADFTFYGGLYRGVDIIAVDETHFDLDYYGGSGIKVTPSVKGKNASVEIETYVTGLQDDDSFFFEILDSDGNVVTSAASKKKSATLEITDVHLWNGRPDPYLYTAKAALKRGETVIDEVGTRFGCRTFRIDPEKGFILNEKEYPLRGVSRHQDRLGIGNALLPCHHEEDIDLIMEVGATTIRLAHYQHDRYFYDLCDEKGLVVWAEIPYISKHLPNGRDNTISQMKELVTQNYNHASIVVWGLSNEITMGGAKDPDLLENHRILNDLVHKMDKTRLTTVACVSMCKIDEEYVHISDVVSYNHYLGWYGGETSMNGPWFDDFHKKYPKKPIGVSEYGCEALNWHTSNPTQGDYTEEYQSYYHEELIKQLFTRPYIWATHVWNMFDFGADARAEGGENGQNHKGLVTMDRKYKKDSFYAYKAWLSDEPFVHLCSKRYIDRVEDVTKVTVYSNLPEVELFVNGKSLGKKTADDHFFKFDVPNVGESEIVAVSGEYKDSGTIRKVDKMNEDYVLKEKGAVLNWFDVDAPEGRFCLNDKMSDIMKTLRGKIWVLKMGLRIKNSLSSGGGEKKKAAGFEFQPAMIQMLGGFTVLRLTSLVSMVNIEFTKEDLLEMNAQLNKIKKPKKLSK